MEIPMSQNTENLMKKLAGLVIFSSMKSDPAVTALTDYFKYSGANDPCAAAEKYADFTRTVISAGGDFSEYLCRLILTDDNVFIRKYFAGDCDALMSQLKYELDVLYTLAHSLPVDPVEDVVFPKIKASHISFREEYLKALPDAAKRGVGVFSKSYMFKLDSKGEFVPVNAYKTQRLSGLVGYDRERRRIVENTESLMAGKPSANALLYGDAGTGKSTTVKAIAAEFANEGLRLIELDTAQISAIPDIIKMISQEPLKFILFIDDLTVSPDSPELSTLKTVLEGGAGTDRSNCVIYVTSNHRHLVKENAADRSGEVNVRDNLQSVLGLSARFGLAVTFLAPDKLLYLDIVKSLAKDHGVEITDNLLTDAEAFAIRRSGRTPRLAKQFVELIAAGIDPIK